MKIIFIGTPEFGAIILEKLIKSGNKPFLVITGSDKLIGRKQTLTPPPVKVLAENYHIPVVQPEKIRNCKEEIARTKPDLIIVVAYGHLIPKEILDIPTNGCINVHPSLLPKYRGASPIQSAILNGDEKTGVSIIRLTEKLDAGPILANSEFQITNQKITHKELEKELADLGAKLLIETISKLFAGEIFLHPQDDLEATYVKILNKEDGKIDWRKSAVEIERQIRALNPEPGTFTNYGDKILKILEVDILSLQTDKKAGEVFFTHDKKIAVQCGQNCLILLKLQIEGGKPLSAQDFLHGHADFISTTLK